MNWKSLGAHARFFDFGTAWQTDEGGQPWRTFDVEIRHLPSRGSVEFSGEPSYGLV